MNAHPVSVPVPAHRSGRSSGPARRLVAGALAALCCAGAGTAAAAPAVAAPPTAPAAAPSALPLARDAQPAAAPGRTVQQRLTALVRDDRFPAALAAVRSSSGRTRNYTAGVAALGTRTKVPVDGQVRIASNTKTFTATVVLQLVTEGKIALDAPVEQYLPGLVRGKGIDGRSITVRQLLQHTSGLPDYVSAIYTSPADLTQALHTHFEPRELLDLALAQPALFPPGDGWAYSNTNYLLAGLLVQKVTGRPVGEQITRRILQPLRLRDTYWPGVGEQRLRGDHPRGYATMPDGSLVDVTEQDPSAPWAAGALVSTPGDLLRFFTALIEGRLLSPEMLEQMQTTVAAPGSSLSGKERYGLGLATFTLSCGGVAWTHGGDIPGYQTRNAVTTDGRGATVTVTALPTTLAAAQSVEDAVDAAICR